MANLNPITSIITLNENQVNTSIKRYEIINPDEKV